MTFLGARLGSASNTITKGGVTVETKTHGVQITLTREFWPTDGTGPGHGDLILWLKNVRVIWLAEFGKPMRVAVLDFERRGDGSVDQIQRYPGSVDLDPKTAQNLLELDPFVAGGPCPSLGNRFVYEPELSFQTAGGKGERGGYTRQMTVADLNERTDFTNIVNETTRGLLAFLGVGPSETKTVTTTISNRNRMQTVWSGTIGATLEWPNIREPVTIDVFFDRVFGTYAAVRNCQSKAIVVAQSVPSTMVAGQRYTVSVRMKNIGGTTWTAAEGYRLGSQNPQDNLTWGLHRVGLPASVAPGGEVTFNFTVIAPSTPGTYNFQWRMVQDGVGWFGDPTPSVAVNVIRFRPRPPNEIGVIRVAP
jgi:hypothetical protein